MHKLNRGGGENNSLLIMVALQVCSYKWCIWKFLDIS